MDQKNLLSMVWEIFEVVKRKSYLQSNGDHNLFYKHSKIGKLTILVVYIEDIIIIVSDNEEI